MISIHTIEDLRRAICQDYIQNVDVILSDVTLFPNNQYYDGDTFVYDNALEEPTIISEELSLAITFHLPDKNDTAKRFSLNPYQKIGGIYNEPIFSTDSWEDVKLFIEKRGILKHLNCEHLFIENIEKFCLNPDNLMQNERLGYITIGNLACTIQKDNFSLSFHFVIPAKMQDESFIVSQVKKVHYAKNDLLQLFPVIEVPTKFKKISCKNLLDIANNPVVQNAITIINKEAIGSKHNLFYFICEKITDTIQDYPLFKTLSTQNLKYLSLKRNVFLNPLPKAVSYIEMYEALEDDVHYDLSSITETTFPQIVRENTDDIPYQNVEFKTYLNRIQFDWEFQVNEYGCSFLSVQVFQKGTETDGEWYPVQITLDDSFHIEVEPICIAEVKEVIQKSMLRIILDSIKEQILPLYVLDAQSNGSLSYDWSALQASKFYDLRAENNAHKNRICGIVRYNNFPFYLRYDKNTQVFYFCDKIESVKSTSFSISQYLSYKSFQFLAKSMIYNIIKKYSIYSENK